MKLSAMVITLLSHHFNSPTLNVEVTSKEVPLPFFIIFLSNKTGGLNNRLIRIVLAEYIYRAASA